MANILVNLEHDVEVAAADVLRFLTASQTSATKAEPGVIAALGVLLGSVEKSLADAAQASSTPLNLGLDATVVADLRAVWPAVAAFATSLGIKL